MGFCENPDQTLFTHIQRLQVWGSLKNKFGELEQGFIKCYQEL